MPEIPEIPDELRDPVSSLVNSAFTLQRVLAIVLEHVIERDGYEGLPPIVAEKHRYLELAERVVDAWRQHLSSP